MMRRLIFKKACPAREDPWVTMGSPLLVDTMMPFIIGDHPQKLDGQDLLHILISIISPLCTISGRIRLMMSLWLDISAASKSPIILSASRTAETSGVVTTMALSAPAMAFLKALLYTGRAVHNDIVVIPLQSFRTALSSAPV
jgi:hypothetical protein